jgi:hypothetical protein
VINIDSEQNNKSLFLCISKNYDQETKKTRSQSLHCMREKEDRTSLTRPDSSAAKSAASPESIIEVSRMHIGLR